MKKSEKSERSVHNQIKFPLIKTKSGQCVVVCGGVVWCGAVRGVLFVVCGRGLGTETLS